MNKQVRRMIALALTALMLSTMLPLSALAALITTDYSGGVSLMSLITPPVNTRTYEFKVDGNTVDTQIIKDGEYLTEPQAPEKPGYRFTGWYVGEEKLLFGPSNPIPVTQTETVEATAKFEQVYYVFFMDSAGDTPHVFRTKSGIKNDQIPTGDVLLPLESMQAVTGWYKDQGLTDGPVGGHFTIETANQHLWPKIETGHYIYFVSGDQGTYVKPQFVSPNGVTVEPSVEMTRPGYTFLHWSTTENGSAYTFGGTIDADVTLYAVWTPNTDTPYTVVFWKQSIHDSKNAADGAKTYDYAESAARTAATGATVSPTTNDGNKNYQGFHYNSGKSVNVTVKGDGTTILNVYYDRNLLTIDFHRNGRPGAEDGEYTGLYGQTLGQNGYTWPSSHRWTENASAYDYGMILTFLDAFIFDDLSALGSTTKIDLYAQTQTGTAQIIHYKENLDGTWSVANTITTGSGRFYFSNKYTGFTVYQYRADNDSWKPASLNGNTRYTGLLEIRHKRNAYNLAFYNHNVTEREETLLFEAPLSEFANYVPLKPAGLPDVYTFQGWFKDKAFSVPFSFG
ncbi:MAG: InlB B-repeat-containing protein [Candidatus Excrementavichristensenella sp.]|jgi:uncharacterized repeat protein (TIGR02543 family)